MSSGTNDINITLSNRCCRIEVTKLTIHYTQVETKPMRSRTSSQYATYESTIDPRYLRSMGSMVKLDIIISE